MVFYSLPTPWRPSNLAPDQSLILRSLGFDPRVSSVLMSLDKIDGCRGRSRRGWALDETRGSEWMLLVAIRQSLRAYEVSMLAEETWWKAVRSIAAIFRAQNDGSQFNEFQIREALEEQAFSSDVIEQAFDWIEKATLSGNLVESLAMLEPPPSLIRIQSTLESLYLPQRIRNRIETCRLKGFISQDVIERLVEGLRTLDSRNMDEDELTHLLAELLSIIVPSTPKHEFLRILKGKTLTLYC